MSLHHVPENNSKTFPKSNHKYISLIEPDYCHSNLSKYNQFEKNNLSHF